MKMLICSFIALLSFTGCKKYLAEKPDKKLQLLETMEAVQGLLDFETTMNLQNPSAGEVSADNYYVRKPTEFSELKNVIYKALILIMQENNPLPGKGNFILNGDLKSISNEIKSPSKKSARKIN